MNRLLLSIGVVAVLLAIVEASSESGSSSNVSDEYILREKRHHHRNRPSRGTEIPPEMSTDVTTAAEYANSRGKRFSQDYPPQGGSGGGMGMGEMANQMGQMAGQIGKTFGDMARTAGNTAGAMAGGAPNMG